MRKSLIALALVGGLLAACNSPETTSKPESSTDASLPVAPAGAPPSPPLPFEFIAYSTGVSRVHVLVHKRTGCAWIGAAQSGYVSGYAAMQPLTEPDGKGGVKQVCDPSIRPAEK